MDEATWEEGIKVENESKDALVTAKISEISKQMDL